MKKQRWGRRVRERKGQYKAHVLSSRLWAWLVSQCHPYKWGPESILVVYVQIPPCPKALAGSGVLNTKPSKTIVSKTLRSKHIGSQWLGIYAPFLIDKMSLGTSSNDNNNKKTQKPQMFKVSLGFWLSCYQVYPFKKQHGMLGSNTSIEYLHAIWLRTNCLSSLTFCFLTCKMGEITSSS